MYYVVYGKDNCSNCDIAKNVLGVYKKAYEYVDVENDDVAYEKIVRDGFRALPAVYVINGCDEVKVGGLSDLEKLLLG